MYTVTQVNKPQDQRKFTRVPFDAKVKVNIDSPQGIQFDGVLMDISFKGLMIEAHPPAASITLGSTGLATIILSTGNIEFDLRVRVKHIEKNSFGLQVEQMPIEAAEHLRALMLHNLGEEQLLQRELQALVLKSEIDSR